MNKIPYFLILIVLWIFSVLVLAAIPTLIIAGSLHPALLGRWCGQPQLWLISIGIVLLLRKYAYKMVFDKTKKFKNTAGIIPIVLGVIWLIMNILPSLIY